MRFGFLGEKSFALSLSLVDIALAGVDAAGFEELKGMRGTEELFGSRLALFPFIPFGAEGGAAEEGRAGAGGFAGLPAYSVTP